VVCEHPYPGFPSIEQRYWSNDVHGNDSPGSTSVQPASSRGFGGATVFASWTALALPYSQSYVSGLSGPVPSHLQTPDDPTGSGMSLFMSVSDQFLSESTWAYDTVSPLLTVVCCQRHCQKAIRTDLEGVPATTEKLELTVSLSLLFLGRSSAFSLGLEDISHHSW